MHPAINIRRNTALSPLIWLLKVATCVWVIGKFRTLETFYDFNLKSKRMTCERLAYTTASIWLKKNLLKACTNTIGSSQTANGYRIFSENMSFSSMKCTCTGSIKLSTHRTGDVEFAVDTFHQRMNFYNDILSVLV